jgi:hypothetical protein
MRVTMNNYHCNYSSIYEKDMKHNEPKLVDCLADEVIEETEKAILFDFDGDEIWIPKSQIEDVDMIERGDVDVIVAIPLWLAEKNEIPYEG